MADHVDLHNKHNYNFRGAMRCGLVGMLGAFVWSVFSVSIMGLFGDTLFEKLIFIVNYPIYYLFAGSIFDAMVRNELVSVHNAQCFFTLLFICYLTTGLFLGIGYYCLKRRCWPKRNIVR